MPNSLEQAIAALKAGQPGRARAQLMDILRHDRCNEEAWLWLSRAVKNEEGSFSSHHIN